MSPEIPPIKPSSDSNKPITITNNDHQVFLASEEDFYANLKKEKPFHHGGEPIKLKFDDTERKNAARAYGLPDDADWYEIYQKQKDIESKLN